MNTLRKGKKRERDRWIYREGGRGPGSSNRVRTHEVKNGCLEEGLELKKTDGVYVAELQG